VKLNPVERHFIILDPASFMPFVDNSFQELSTDNTLRIIILTGNGSSFCAGADLNWMKAVKDYIILGLNQLMLRNFGITKK
jgi:enoyl-CoA hydratase/carnithine racemase